MVRRRLNQIGRVARQKLYVNKVNRHKCFEYAKNYREKPLDFWNKALWSDEGKLHLFVSDGKVVRLRRSLKPSASHPLSNMLVGVSSVGLASHRQMCLYRWQDDGRVISRDFTAEKLGMSNDWILPSWQTGLPSLLIDWSEANSLAIGFHQIWTSVGWSRTAA